MTNKYEAVLIYSVKDSSGNETSITKNLININNPPKIK